MSIGDRAGAKEKVDKNSGSSTLFFVFKSEWKDRR